MKPFVLISDDHPLFRDALNHAVANALPDHDIQEASNLAETQVYLKDGNIHLLLLDLHMSDSHGFSGLIDFRREFPALPIIVVSASEDDSVIAKAIHFGAAGFIPKSSSLNTMIDAIQAVVMGDVWVPANVDLTKLDDSEESVASKENLQTLTGAQLKVLQAVIRGLLNKQIAYEMGITEATVKAHLTSIFRKLGVINRTQAVLVAKELDLSEPAIES